MQNNRERVLAWIQAGHIQEKDIGQALQVVQTQPDKQQWYQFSKQVLLWMSVICACSGVIFFFAYNWQALSRLMRFSLVEGALLILSFSYLRCSANQKLKVALLMAMALLTGSLLALVGQTYQTGADPWQLFVIWCVLITPWAFIARSSVIWIFWVALLNIGCLLFFQLNVNLQWFSSDHRAGLLLNLVTINAGLLILFELGAKFNPGSLFNKLSLFPADNRYTQQVLLSLSTYLLCHWAIEGIFQDRESSYLIVLYLVVSALVYRFLIQDLLALAVISLGFLAFSSASLFRGLEFVDADFEGYMLLGACYILGVSSLMGMYLKKVIKVFAQQQSNGLKTTVDNGEG